MQLAKRLGLTVSGPVTRAWWAWALGGLGCLAVGCNNAITPFPDGGGADLFTFMDGGPLPVPPQVTSSWVFEHPLPQGNSLYASLTTGSDTYAVGDLGAVVHATAAGTIAREAIGVTQSTLRALTGTPANLWIVGDSGAIVHGQNGSYTPLRAGSTPLYAVWTLGGTVYAAGQGSQLWSLAAGAATFTSSTLPGESATASILGAVTSGTDVYLVGTGGRILHQLSGKWFLEGDGLTSEDLEAAAVGGDGSIYAVGVAGTILRKDPVKGWALDMSATQPLTRAELRAVWPSGDAIYAAALDGTLLRRTQSWALDGAKVAPGLLFGGSGGSAGSWVVGQSGSLLRRGPSDTDTWALAQPTSQLTIANLNAVSASDSVGYAVTADGKILKRTGSGASATWTVDFALPAAKVQPLTAVSVLGTEAYAVGLEGTLLHNTGAGWVAETFPWPAGNRLPDLRGVWLHQGGASVDAYAVGSTLSQTASEVSVILHRSGATWATETTTPELDEALFSVVGDGTDVIAVGTGGSIVLRSASGWTPENEGQADDIELYAVAAGNNTFYAAGTKGTVFTRTAPANGMGAMWQRSTIPQASVNLTGLAVSGSDLWVVGGGGAVAHQKGGSWTAEYTLSTSNLSGVVLAGTSLIAVGSGGTVLRRDL